MNELILKLEKRFNAFSLRERIIMGATVLVVVYFIWHTVLYDYVLASDEEITRQNAQMKSQINLIEEQIDSISQMLGRNPTSVLVEQAKNLKRENENLNRLIDEATRKMVSPKDMVAILSNLIAKTHGLTIIRIESLESKPLFEHKNIMRNGKTVPFQVYNHGLRIEMIGSYFETLQFLKKLENQNMNVIWDSISYEVQKYPEAKITIILHMLSLNAGWIDV